MPLDHGNLQGIQKLILAHLETTSSGNHINTFFEKQHFVDLGFCLYTKTKFIEYEPVQLQIRYFMQLKYLVT